MKQFAIIITQKRLSQADEISYVRVIDNDEDKAVKAYLEMCEYIFGDSPKDIRSEVLKIGESGWANKNKAVFLKEVSE